MAQAACYLCAYQRPELPRLRDLLPGRGTPADRPLASCHACSVWVCSQHGKRYQVFECAICTPALAVKYAFGSRDGEDAAEQARRVSGDSPPGLEVERERLDQLTQRNLRDLVIRDTVVRASRSLGPAQPGRYGLVEGYPQAVGAAIRSSFDQMVEVYLRQDAPAIVSGAINLAYLIGDPSYNRRGRRDPWEVQFPRLIDPVIWLAVTAEAGGGA